MWFIITFIKRKIHNYYFTFKTASISNCHHITRKWIVPVSTARRTAPWTITRPRDRLRDGVRLLRGECRDALEVERAGDTCWAALELAAKDWSSGNRTTRISRGFMWTILCYWKRILGLLSRWSYCYVGKWKIHFVPLKSHLNFCYFSNFICNNNKLVAHLFARVKVYI